MADAKHMDVKTLSFELALKELKSAHYRRSVRLLKS